VQPQWKFARSGSPLSTTTEPREYKTGGIDHALIPFRCEIPTIWSASLHALMCERKGSTTAPISLLRRVLQPAYRHRHVPYVRSGFLHTLPGNGVRSVLRSTLNQRRVPPLRPRFLRCRSCLRRFLRGAVGHRDVFGVRPRPLLQLLVLKRLCVGTRKWLSRLARGSRQRGLFPSKVRAPLSVLTPAVLAFFSIKLPVWPIS
jgi:hypothetical protein